MGEPIEEDDMSLWKTDDFERANDTIAMIKARGWEQRDLRGSNFVRLADPGGVKELPWLTLRV